MAEQVLNDAVNDVFAEVAEQEEKITEKKSLPRPKKHRIKKGELASDIVTYVVLILYAIVQMFPFAIIILTALSKQTFLIETLGFRVPGFSDMTFDNFKEAVTSDVAYIYVNGKPVNSLLLGFWNTLWQTVPTTLIGLFVSGLAGYGYAKLRFRGKSILYAIQTAIIALPLATLTMPSYLFYYTIGWTDTVLPVIIPGMFGSAVTVFYLSQFFHGLPTEIIEAARIDGLGSFGIYVRIILPLSVPAIVTQGILAFVGGYNNFLGALLYITEESQYPLQRALYFINGCYDEFSMAGVICASTILAMLPLIIIYIFGRKQLRVGIVSGAVKA